MLRVKFVVQAICIPALVICATVGLTTAAHAAVTVKFAATGSSAMWQNFALAAYNSGSCPGSVGGPCHHYTGKGFLLRDCRGAATGCTQTPGTTDEANNIWIVWDNGGANANVWEYLVVDSIVGDRCYFASPRCRIMPPTGGFPAPANLITLAGTVWGGASADVLPPAAVQAAVTASVTAGMTDVRPEDAFYQECRLNASLSGDPEAKGLGYNPANVESGAGVPLVCPANKSGTSHLVGESIKSAFSTSTAQVISFNISGTDPFTGNSVVSGTVVPVGASPIIFITRRNNSLKSLLHATDTQLQCVFTENGGPLQNASCFGLAAADINVIQREPLSGTMTTTENTVFRNDAFQLQYSQENKVNPAVDNPLQQIVGPSCPDGGHAGRFHPVGTGQLVSEIKASTSPACNTADAIGYTFFSFGNVSSIANSPSYAYLTLDGIDPIGPGPLLAGNNELPGSPFPAAAGCAGNTFPCTEQKLWGAGKFSFPGLRAAGTLSGPPYSPNVYRAWSVLRLISDGTNLTNAKALVSGAQNAAVCQVPDFVPYVKVVSSCGITDPGLALYRSHYKLVTSTINISAPNNGLVGTETGRDVAGCIFAKPAPGNAGTLNLGQEYSATGTNNGKCSAPSFP